jgi:hypothetical protein
VQRSLDIFKMAQEQTKQSERSFKQKVKQVNMW